jgi:hypothetical protein
MSLSNHAINPEYETAPEGVVPELENKATPELTNEATHQEILHDEHDNPPKEALPPSELANAVSDLNDDAEQGETEQQSTAIGLEKETTEVNNVESEDEVDGRLEESERDVDVDVDVNVEDVESAEIEPASADLPGASSDTPMDQILDQRLLSVQQGDIAGDQQDIVTPDTAANDEEAISADREIGDASEHAISRTASPASNASTGQIRPSSASASVPKKFSSVNINKKFLGKTAVVAPTATAPNFGGLGMKPVGALGSLGGA